MTRDAQGRLLVGTDGGVWRRETNGNWTNLNGNLGVAQINGVAGHPTDLKIAYAGAQSNGALQFTNNLNWAYLDDKTAGQTFNSGGGQVRVDPNDPNNVYYVELRTGGNAIIRRSLSGGAPGTWTTLPVNTFRTVAPLVLDSILTTRLLVGGSTLQESFNQGNSWTNLSVPPALPFVSEIGIATFQGAFQADPVFSQNADNGSNTYDPDTIYVTDGNSVFLTKNHGVSWTDRTTGLAGLGFIVDLEVDPTHRDTVYAVRNVTNGGVWQTTDAGQNWTEITHDLPSAPVWKVVLDPRTKDLYVGTDLGVYRLLFGTTHWQHFGNGLANTQVRDLELNPATNTLLAGTYGRGVYRLFLDDGAANAGALRAVSGTSIWTGPVYLAGDTTVSAKGTQTLQNGSATASLTIVGIIQDAPGTASPGRLTKIGQGNVILAGTNTYAGVTEVVEGVLIVQNPRALGDPAAAANTIVNAGTALELQSDLELEPITLNGDGILFNNHFQGALRNSSNFNTYTGPLTLATNSTIGVDSGSQLTIGSKTGLLGIGSIDDLGANFTLTKELTGTLSLGGPNAYGGTTFVNQGALQVEHAEALGDGGGAVGVNGTLVRDGAQLQMHTPTTGAFAGVNVVVAAESLSLSGTGIFGTGVLYNTGGDNTWSGPILLDIQPGLAPDTAPPGVVAFGVSTAGDSLTINPAAGLTETAATGINKVGPGTLVLSTANHHTGTTYINNGIVNIQDSGALGTTPAFNEIQRVTVIGPMVGPGTFDLTLNGQTTGQLAFGAPATGFGSVQNALNGLSSIGGVGGSVSVVRTGPIDTPSGTQLWVYTVTFIGTMAGVNQNFMSGTGSTASTDVIVTTVADGSIGTRVANGAALEVQGAGLVVAEALALNGAGAGNAGALHNLGGDNTWSGDVFFQSNSAIGADAGTQLTASG
ncbi:MAG: autotransporter-associated beta strand repeat-containing protein [Gemmataceae bacterium]|nr:autotransporter-associated beta strand repeat-containing protein [Gemmataceae bacterium]